jgi:hypothetical protein
MLTDTKLFNGWTFRFDCFRSRAKRAVRLGSNRRYLLVTAFGVTAVIEIYHTSEI